MQCQDERDTPTMWKAIYELKQGLDARLQATSQNSTRNPIPSEVHEACTISLGLSDSVITATETADPRVDFRDFARQSTKYRVDELAPAIAKLLGFATVAAFNEAYTKE